MPELDSRDFESMTPRRQLAAVGGTPKTVGGTPFRGSGSTPRLGGPGGATPSFGAAPPTPSGDEFEDGSSVAGGAGYARRMHFFSPSAASASFLLLMVVCLFY